MVRDSTSMPLPSVPSGNFPPGGWSTASAKDCTGPKGASNGAASAMKANTSTMAPPATPARLPRRSNRTRPERFPRRLSIIPARRARKALWIRYLSHFLSENRSPLFRKMPQPNRAVAADDAADHAVRQADRLGEPQMVAGEHVERDGPGLLDQRRRVDDGDARNRQHQARGGGVRRVKIA